MKQVTFESFKDLAAYMEYKSSNNIAVTSVLFFNDALNLLKELLLCNGIDTGYIELSNVEYNGYNKEYYISLSGDKILSVEPAWDEQYINNESDLILIHGDANSRIIKNKLDKSREIYIDLN